MYSLSLSHLSTLSLILASLSSSHHHHQHITTTPPPQQPTKNNNLPTTTTTTTANQQQAPQNSDLINLKREKGALIAYDDAVGGNHAIGGAVAEASEETEVPVRGPESRPGSLDSRYRRFDYEGG